MSDPSTIGSEGFREIEVELDDDARLELETVEIDGDGNTLSFHVAGQIQGIEDETMGRVRGKSLVPVAVRFEVKEQ